MSEEPGRCAVWLDDERDMPDRYDVHVRTAAEAIDLLRTGRVVEISLDNDLGLGQPEGRTVADWIEREAAGGRLRRLRCRVHTANPAARAVMLVALRRAYEHWEGTDDVG